MKQIIKNVITCICMVAICLTTSITLVGCGKKDESKIMNVSVNPSLEFVLDKNDKVISVNATNEDAAYILEEFSSFTGMSAGDAALKLLELAEEHGFVVSGSVNSEEINISISGNNAQTLYNNVKSKMQEKATELSLEFSEFTNITKENIEELVAEMYQEYTASELHSMTQEELISMVKQSREETKELFTSDERMAYYRERAQKVISAKIDTIQSYIDNNSSIQNIILTPIVAAMENAYESLQTTYETLNTQIEALYNTAETGINAKLDEYIDAKKEYLTKVEEYKQALANSEDVVALKAEMEQLKAQAESMKSTLETQRENAKQQLMTTLNTTVHTQLALLNTQINNVLEHISLTITEIEQAVQSQITELKNQYQQATTNPWQDVA